MSEKQHYQLDQILRQFQVDHEMISHAVTPFTTECFDRGSKEASYLVRQRRNLIIHLVINKIVNQIKSGIREKNKDTVKTHYESDYAVAPFRGYKTFGRPVTFIEHDRVSKMYSTGVYWAMIKVIEQLLETINPRTLCEIGCGTGRHVMYFARKYPSIKCSGVDLAEAAIKLANDARNSDNFDLHIPDDRAPYSETEMGRIRDAQLYARSASDLWGIEADAFDVSYSTAALEQMWDILPDVLAEIRRVTKRYVIFCEPFLEYNSVLSRAFLYSGNYFRARHKHIEDAGFEIIGHYDCLPVKPSFKYSVLLAKVVKD